MFNKKSRKIANQKAMIDNRDKFIDRQAKEYRELKEENIALCNENKDLRFENKEQKDLINALIKELYSNIKTDKQKVEKLKELVSDYQSLN